MRNNSMRNSSTPNKQYKPFHANRKQIIVNELGGGGKKFTHLGFHQATKNKFAAIFLGECRGRFKQNILTFGYPSNIEVQRIESINK